MLVAVRFRRFPKRSKYRQKWQWIVDDRCRLMALLGMGGIGKTSLAAKLGEQIQGEFEYVVWRSLKDAPPTGDGFMDLCKV